MKSVLIARERLEIKLSANFFLCLDSEWGWMVLSGNQGGADVKHPRCQQQETLGGLLLSVCVCVSTNIWIYAYECTNKCMSAQVCTSLPVNMYVYMFGLPSVPQQRPGELFSRSLATLIMSGPPQSINQPSAVPTQPTNRSSGQWMCLCVH